MRCPLPLALLASIFQAAPGFSSPWTTARKLELREKTRSLWNHGFDAYMDYAFPTDELMPLSCFGRGPDRENPMNIGINDVAGNFSVTLVDVLDTLVVMNNKPGFEKAIRDTIDWVGVDVDTRPQVFETTIRVLGGLLSGHIFASEEQYGFRIDWYRGELLKMAYELGERMLPAFNTPTGIPFARINMRRGVLPRESTYTCTAGAGSLIMEFGTLSRLTGDDRFEKAASRAFFALWKRRSSLGLVGNAIDVVTGAWYPPETTNIGAGVDSFYEYAFKWFILSGEEEFLEVWQEAYDAVMNRTRGVDGYWFRTVYTAKGNIATTAVDSLSAFWAGLQVFSGDVPNAIRSHLVYWNLWQRFKALPEVFDVATKEPRSTGYPLRPEFIESTFFLYQATKDDFYLDVGEQVLADLTERAKVACGLASNSDVTKPNQLDDRMESFVLSETLKYLYLLFDEENPFTTADSTLTYTTEAHLLTFSPTQLRHIPTTRKLKHGNLQCPAYEPLVLPAQYKGTGLGLVHGIRSHPYYEYARHLAGVPTTDSVMRKEGGWWEAYATCEKPNVEYYSWDFLLTADGKPVSEDIDPFSLSEKIISDWHGGILLQNASGVRFHATTRSDNRGYDITQIGHIRISPGRNLYINDTSLFSPADKEALSSHRIPAIPIRFYVKDSLARSLVDTVEDYERNIIVKAYTAFFGADPYRTAFHNGKPSSTISLQGLPLIRFSDNEYGCEPFVDPSHRARDAMVMLRRGECFFVQKLAHAMAAGALGAVVWSEPDEPINPSAEAEDVERFRQSISQGLLFAVVAESGQFINDLFNASEDSPDLQMMMRLESSWPDGMEAGEELLRVDDESGAKRTKFQMLYVNGQAMVNTVLLF